jgi:NAD(P)-dependent dehydrogenase (short-subunit alcohol dehydrogenase family)
MVNLKGRTAVITGGGSGIGRGFARALAARGANVALIGRQYEQVRRAADELREKAGVLAEGYSADVSNADAVESVAEQIYGRFGSVHILANNAAVSTAGHAWETTLDDWRQVIDVNLMGAVHGLRSFIPRMIEAGEQGHIVNVSSMGGLLPVPMKAPYTAAKHAMIGMSKALRAEFSAAGVPIKVSVVCPGPVATDMVDAQLRRYDRDPRFSAESRAVLEQLKAQVDNGMSADTAGLLMVQAIERGQFWVFLNAGDYFQALDDQHAEIRASEHPPFGCIAR